MSANTEKMIGKIKSVTVGGGGYQDAMFGVSFELGSDKDGWGCGDFWGFWGPDVKWQKRCKWTEEGRQKTIGGAFYRLAKIMQDAKVNNLNKLVGVPVEVEFEGGSRKSWRILTEVV